MCTYICEYLPIYVKGPLPAFLHTFNSLSRSTTVSLSSPSHPVCTFLHLPLIIRPLQKSADVSAHLTFWHLGFTDRWCEYSRWVAGETKKGLRSEVKGQDTAALINGALLVSLRWDRDSSVFSFDPFGVRQLRLVSVLTFGGQGRRGGGMGCQHMKRTRWCAWQGIQFNKLNVLDRDWQLYLLT